MQKPPEYGAGGYGGRIIAQNLTIFAFVSIFIIAQKKGDMT